MIVALGMACMAAQEHLARGFVSMADIPIAEPQPSRWGVPGTSRSIKWDLGAKGGPMRKRREHDVWG